MNHSSLLGKYVIVRTYSAGVHVGTITSLKGKEAVLSDARRIWSWKGAFTLSEIANHGVGNGSKLSEEVPVIILTEVIEVIPVSADSEKQLKSLGAYKP